jgi:hypothetical protein
MLQHAKINGLIVPLRGYRMYTIGAEHASSTEIPIVNGSNQKVEFCNSL